MAMKKLPWRLLVKLIISGLLLAVLFSRADPTVLVSALSSFRPSTLAFALSITLLGTVLATFRWWLLLPETRFLNLLQFSFIGQFYAFVLPGQIAGEAVKAWRISRGRKDAARVAASVTIDRVLGLLGLLLVGLVGLLLSSQPPARALILPFVLLLSALALLLIACGLPAAPRISTRLLQPFAHRSGFLAKAASAWQNFLSAWRTYLGLPMRLAASLAVAVVFQLAAVLVYRTLAENLGIVLPAHDWCWIVAITSVAVLLPVSFAGIGLREGALVGCLVALGMGNEAAIALSLGVFAMMACGAAVGGLLDLISRPSHSATTHKENGA